MKFPRYERNLVKKGLTAHAMEFLIHGEVWDEYGDAIPVYTRFLMEHNGELRRIDYDAPGGRQETMIQINQVDARRFLKAVVQQLNAIFWDEDLNDAGPIVEDPYLDILPEYRPDYGAADEDNEAERPAPDPGREPLWSLYLSLNDGSEKEITFYNQIHDAQIDLFWSLMELSEPDEDDSEPD